MKPSSPKDPWAAARQSMVETQIAGRGVRDPRVLDVMRSLPRERFLPDPIRSSAYEDRAMPIGFEQTISQPYIVAYMTEQLQLTPECRILEIGTGSGYQTAILARLSRHVYTIERIATLQKQAAALLADLGISNVSYKIGDGTLGWPEHAPFDRILAAAGAPRVPPVVAEQLIEGGIFILPIGTPAEQTVSRITRKGPRIVETPLLACRFVKLLGTGGWPEDSKSS